MSSPPKPGPPAASAAADGHGSSTRPHEAGTSSRRASPFSFFTETSPHPQPAPPPQPSAWRHHGLRLIALLASPCGARKHLGTSQSSGSGQLTDAAACARPPLLASWRGRASQEEQEQAQQGQQALRQRKEQPQPPQPAAAQPGACVQPRQDDLVVPLDQLTRDWPGAGGTAGAPRRQQAQQPRDLLTTTASILRKLERREARSPEARRPADHDDLEARKSHLLKMVDSEQRRLHAAQARLRALEDAHPELVLPADALGCHLPGSALIVVGAGTFACCFVTSQLPAPPRLQARYMQANTHQRLLVPLNSPGIFNLVIKALQLPAGQAKQERHWPPGFLAKPVDYSTTKGLTRHLENLRYEHFFTRECEALIVCGGHRNIVTCFGWCLHHDRLLPTLCLEYAGSRDLWRTLRGSSCSDPVDPSWEQAVAIMFQVLAAIDHMHHRLPAPAGPGTHRVCIHRDISPGNVMVTWSSGSEGLPHVRLVDFGLAELKTDADCPPPAPVPPYSDFSLVTWEQEGIAVGPDLKFMDPLMWTKRLYGLGTDVFAWGQIALLLLFGQLSVPNFVHGSTTEEKFVAAWDHRDQMRLVLTKTIGQALRHPALPIHPRWQQCPSMLLSLLMRQARKCTTARREDALLARPTTPALLADLCKYRHVMPPRLALLLPEPPERRP